MLYRWVRFAGAGRMNDRVGAPAVRAGHSASVPAYNAATVQSKGEGPSRGGGVLRFLGRVALVAAVYGALNAASSYFQTAPDVSLIFPASAAGVVAALCWRWEAALGIFLATLWTPWSAAEPWLTRLFFGIGNCAEALIPSFMLRPRRGASDQAMFGRFLLWAGSANVVANFALAELPQAALGLRPLDLHLGQVFVGWLLADATAIAVFGLPFVLYLRPELVFERPERLSWRFLRERRLEVAAAVAMIAAVSCAIYLHDLAFESTFNWPALFYLIPLCWLLVLGGLPATAAGTAVVALAYFTTLGFETGRLAVEPLRSSERMIAIYGNVWTFFVFAVFAGMARTRRDWLVDELRQRWQELRSAFDATVSAFGAAIGARDPATAQHHGRVSSVAVALARALGLSAREVDIVYYGAALHDIGKLGIAHGLLSKAGPLTDEERAEIDRHAEIGARIAERAGVPQEVVELVRCHEERWDGKTFGLRAANIGLAGEAIPLGARIIAVADTFDAMVSPRPYRATPGPRAAAVELRREAGKQFDPAVVEAFLALLSRGGVPEVFDTPVTPELVREDAATG